MKVSWALEHGQGRPAGGESRKRTTIRTRSRSIRPAAARTTGRRCPTTRTPGWSTFRRPTRASPIRRRRNSGPAPPGYVRPSGATKTIEPSFGPEPPAGARGGLQAWDPVNQKLKWNVEGGGGIGGGTTTTAGNLVFQVINDGRFRAISADKGEILYEVQTGRTGHGSADHVRSGRQAVCRVRRRLGPRRDRGRAEQRQGGQPADDVRVRAGRQG